MSVALERFSRDGAALRLTQEESKKLWRLFRPVAEYLAGISGARLGLLSAVDGEDVAQEAFVLFARQAVRGGLECLGKRRIADIEDGDLDRYMRGCRTYLIHIAERKCCEFHRKRKSQFRVIGQWIDRIQEPKTDPASDLSRLERIRSVRRAVKQLPEHLRKVWVLRYYIQYSEKEIAARLGVSVRMVKYRLHELRERLRTLLSSEQLEGRGKRAGKKRRQ